MLKARLSVGLLALLATTATPAAAQPAEGPQPLPPAPAPSAQPPAPAAGLCERLSVPEGYELICETRRVADGAPSEQATVRPATGTGAALARLSLRPLERETAPLAWSDPRRWLEEQVALDLGGIGAGLRTLGLGDGPLAHPAAQAMVEGLLATLAGWGRLPLQGCTPDEADTTRRELRCAWGTPPLGLAMNLRLVEAGDRRYAVSYWAVDEQRIGHLEAIANSFRPG